MKMVMLITTNIAMLIFLFELYAFCQLGKKILTTLPENLSDDWLESLPLITINPDSQIYSDSKLESMILDIKDRLERGEPTVEFKVSRC